MFVRKICDKKLAFNITLVFHVALIYFIHFILQYYCYQPDDENVGRQLYRCARIFSILVEKPTSVRTVKPLILKMSSDKVKKTREGKLQVKTGNRID